MPQHLKAAMLGCDGYSYRYNGRIMTFDAPTLRSAQAADVPAMLDVFLSARADAMPWLPVLHTISETQWWLANVVLPSGGVTVAEAGGRPLGFSALSGNALDHLYVHPSAQGRGVGSQLMAAAMRDSPAGLRLNVFQRNTAARAFYELHGFRVVALREGSENEEGLPDAVYRWTPRH